jgi:hypothetical protein
MGSGPHDRLNRALTAIAIALGACFALFQVYAMTESNPTLRCLLIPAIVVAAVVGWVTWNQAIHASPDGTSKPTTPPAPPKPTTPPAPPKRDTTVWRDRAGTEYIWVPAGAGLAGCWMMRTPVTNAMWRTAVQAGAVGPPRDTAAYDDAAKTQHPVVWVTRDMARAYATWVGGRLPRDAEWTRAAQGDDGRTYPWGEQPPDATRANCRPHGPGDTTPAGSYPAGASPYGLLDMAGNVWEWVDDGDFVVRGGAFYVDAAGVVCGARHKTRLLRFVNFGALGFRVVSPGP